MWLHEYIWHAAAMIDRQAEDSCVESAAVIDLMQLGFSIADVLCFKRSALTVSELMCCLQDITAGAVAALGKGCFWNQDVKSMLAEAGFQPTRLQTTLGGLITAVEAKKATP